LVESASAPDPGRHCRERKPPEPGGYQHRLDLLRVGAAGQLFMAGILEEVVPVDDAELLARANPVAEDGGVNLDREIIEARQDAQVRAMIEGGRFALVILGGAHDLADNVAKLAGRDGEYVRVTTRWGRRFEVATNFANGLSPV